MELSYVSGGKQMLQSLWKTVKQFLIKLNIYLNDDPSSLPPRYLTKENGSICPHKYLYVSIDSSFVHKSLKLETTRAYHLGDG